MFLDVGGQSSDDGFIIHAILPCLHYIRGTTDNFDPALSRLHEIHHRAVKISRRIYYAALLLLVLIIALLAPPTGLMFAAFIVLLAGRVVLMDSMDFMLMSLETNIPHWHSAEHRLVAVLRNLPAEGMLVTEQHIREAEAVSSSCGTVYMVRKRIGVLSVASILITMFVATSFGSDSMLTALAFVLNCAMVLLFLLHIPIGRRIQATYALADPGDRAFAEAAALGNRLIQHAAFHAEFECE